MGFWPAAHWPTRTFRSPLRTSSLPVRWGHALTNPRCCAAARSLLDDSAPPPVTTMLTATRLARPPRHLAVFWPHEAKILRRTPGDGNATSCLPCPLGLGARPAGAKEERIPRSGGGRALDTLEAPLRPTRPLGQPLAAQGSESPGRRQDVAASTAASSSSWPTPAAARLFGPYVSPPGESWGRIADGQEERILFFWTSNSISLSTPASLSSPSCLSWASFASMSPPAGSAGGGAA